MKHLLLQGFSKRKGHKLAGRAQGGGMEGSSKGFNPQKAPPRPTHALAAVFLLRAALGIGVESHLHFSSSSGEAKACSGAGDRAATPERAVFHLPCSCHGWWWVSNPSGLWGRLRGKCHLLHSGAKLPLMEKDKACRGLASIFKRHLW